MQNTPPHQHRPRSESGRLEGSERSEQVAKTTPRGGLLRVQDRLPVGDDRGRGSCRRGTLGVTGERPGAAALGRAIPVGTARLRGGAEASGSLGMDLGRRRVDGHPRLDDRAPRRAASWRRRRRAGGAMPRLGTPMPSLGSRHAEAGARPGRGTCAVRLPVGNRRWMLQTRWPTSGANPSPPGIISGHGSVCAHEGGPTRAGESMREAMSRPGVWERHGAARRGP